MLIYVAIAAGLIAAYMLVVTMRPLVDKAVVTADDWQRLEDDSMGILLRRDRIIDELRDLEFEHALDKVEKRDLDVLRRRYEGEALRLMGEIEAHVGAYDERINGDVKDAIERARHRRAARVAKKAVANLASAAAPEPEANDAEVAATEPGQSAVAPVSEDDPPEMDSVASPDSEKTAEAETGQGPAGAGSEDGPAPHPSALPEMESTANTGAEGSEDSKAPTDADTTDAAEAPGEESVAARVPRDWIRDVPCEQCGTVVSVGSSFCDGCGAGVVTACEGCGGHNRLAARFCRTCGESLAEKVTS